ncbi:MAG: FliM/FliN family flagellar motor switch protein [Terriglobales bacterium]
MADAPLPPPGREGRNVGAWAELWSKAALQVIRELSSDQAWRIADPNPDPLPAAEVGGHLEIGGGLQGKQQLRLHRTAGHGWARLKLSGDDAADKRRTAELDEAEMAALGEIMPLIVAAVGARLASGAWGEVRMELRHFGPLRRKGEDTSAAIRLRFSHPNSNALDLEMLPDAELFASLRGELPPAAEAGAGAGAETDREAQPPGPESVGITKLDMLLDVEMDTTLRFGGRQTLLHDVLELSPGSVLELDRHIDDPVELLVGGKIIAWGEVVVVDGNYGLRVTRLVQRSERLAALEAAR